MIPRTSTKAFLSASIGVAALAAAVPAQGIRHPPTHAYDAPVACAGKLPAGTACTAGRDANGAYYTLVMPAAWNRQLVVYAHGGPSLTAVAPMSNPNEYAIAATLPLVQHGFAIAATTYRDQRWRIDEYGEDLKNVREAFIGKYERPLGTVLYGFSFGAAIGNRALERYPSLFNAAVFHDGVVDGVYPWFYEHLDFRVVYQHYCGNLPLPSEPRFPLFQGIDFRAVSPTDITPMLAFRDEATERAIQCTGFGLAAEARTPAQERALRNVMAVTHTAPEMFLQNVTNSTIGLATFLHDVTDGRNAFTNRGVRYRGSDDDEALNRGVARYDADAEAERLVREKFQPTGRLPVPVITLHSIHDTRAPVDWEADYARLVGSAGAAAKLLQVYETGTGHIAGDASAYQRPTLPLVAIQAAFEWAATGHRPAVADLAARCNAERSESPLDVCAFDPSFTPQSIWRRIPAEGRQR